ncbi:hypothetical protein K3495_g10391 [Podosphaera aphanis]|nr:hypothetical protein K3495_g10391 [Podosphaera aphanis]
MRRETLFNFLGSNLQHVSNLVKGYLSLLQKVVRTSARAILPVYRTTPAAALYREAGLPPPEIALDSKLRQAALRIHRLDPRHPLRRRNMWILSQQRRVSRLSGWALNLPPTEYLDPLVDPPWQAKESWCSRTRRVTRTSRRLPEGIPSQDMVIYSDGSRLDSVSGPRVGGGVAILQAGRLICQKRIPLSPSLEIFDAEAVAALTALEIAVDLPSARFASNLWVLLDNLDVARQLLSTPTCSSQEIISRFASKAREWPHRSRLPHVLPGGVKVHWIPGHSGIPGNTLADAAAKEAMNMPPPPPSPLTFASAKTWVSNSKSGAYKDYWLQNAPKSYQDLEIDFLAGCPAELSLPRQHVAHIYAARSGHGDFASYHARFDHDSAHNTCSCV